MWDNRWIVWNGRPFTQETFKRAQIVTLVLTAVVVVGTLTPVGRYALFGAEVHMAWTIAMLNAKRFDDRNDVWFSFGLGCCMTGFLTWPEFWLKMWDGLFVVLAFHCMFAEAAFQKEVESRKLRGAL